jgi:hypothetical protein
MATSARAEIGSFGFVRQQPDVRGLIKGVGGRSRTQNAGGLTAHRHSTQAEAPQQQQPPPVQQHRPPAAIGSYPAPRAPAPRPSAAPPQLDDSEAAVVQGVLAEWRGAKTQLEDVEAFKGRLDGLALRVNSQDTALKALERSTAALRQEYSAISRSTGGQSDARVAAVERSLERLETAFQDFSARLERRVDEAASSVQASTLTEALAAATPYDATTLAALAEDLPPLTRVFLYLPLQREADGSITMHRRRLDAEGQMHQSSVKVQSASGEPLVVFA